MDARRFFKLIRPNFKNIILGMVLILGVESLSFLIFLNAEMHLCGLRRLRDIQPELKRVDPNSLFPIQIINEILRKKGLEPAEARVIAWKDKRLRVILYSGTTMIAELELNVSNKLDLLTYQPRLPVEYEEILLNEKSKYQQMRVEHIAYGLRSVTYSNLNPMVRLDSFWINEEILNEDVKKVWFSEYIEPYIRKRGINITAIIGEWSKVGYFVNNFNFLYPVSYYDPEHWELSIKDLR